VTSSLQLFGAPVLRCDETPVRFPRRKAMALLAYLAVTRSRHHRESLATMLWPESTAVAAHSALRNLLWCLRTTPISEFLSSDRSTMELVEDERLVVDVNSFRDLVGPCPSRSHGTDRACAECAPRLTEAASLWKGAFMTGYVAANSAQFDDWQLAEGEALRRELSETLSRVVEFYLSIEDWASGARYARQWLQVDELNEFACRSLIRALAEQGLRSEALQVYDECARTLADRLGLVPESETVALAESLRSARSPVETVPRRRRRLPPPPGRMIGRQAIAERIEHLLLDERTRAVHLVGLGGAGKTSLALYAGRHVEDRFAHGAAYVSIDTLPDDALIASAIQTTLRLPSRGEEGFSPEDQIADALADREMLLVLDGAERFLGQIACLIASLRSAPGVCALITSRVEMSMPDVASIPVHGLECPPDDAGDDELADYPAVSLLRIAAERHGLAPDDSAEELRDVAHLARILEGSPLALEMAAGWRSILPWQAIASRVANDPSFLVHRDVGTLPKHQTLAAVFDQSWKLLPPDGQAALRGVSIFRGPFTTEAAENVVGTHPGPLATLVNRGLLLRAGPEHYRMHELVRQFAAKKLRETPVEEERVCVRHVEHYTNALSDWFDGLKGPEQFPTLLRMEREIKNVRHAFQQAAVRGDHERLRSASLGLAQYCNMRSAVSEAESVFAGASRAYGQHEDRDRTVDAFLRIAAGYFASWDRLDVAFQRREEGIDLLPGTPPEDELHAMACLIYVAACFKSDREENVKRVQACLAYYRDSGDRWGEASALDTFSLVESYENPPESETYARQSLSLRREIGDAWGESLIQFRLARLAEAGGDHELALALYRDTGRLIAPYSAEGFGGISVLIAQARVLAKLGDTERSAKLAQEAIQRGREAGYRFQVARSLIALASSAREEGDRASARAHLEEAFGELASIRWHKFQAECALMLAEVALDDSDVGGAERWLHEAEDLDSESARIPALRERIDGLRDESPPTQL